MIHDLHAVIWTRTSGTPQKLSDMVLTDTELRITKTEEAIASGLPGASLLHDLANEPQVVFKRTDWQSLPQQIASLIPPRDYKNPQRRILGRLLDKRIETRGMQPIEQDWHMLLFCGRNGIGHLDVFKDDIQAAKYYETRAMKDVLPSTGTGFWFAFKRLVSDLASEDDERLVSDTVGPTPGISGFMSKLPMPIALDGDNNWHGESFGDKTIQAVVKLERGTHPGVLHLESLAYDYHRRAGGFVVPQDWLLDLDHQGDRLTLLATERFDRVAGIPLPQESLFCLLNTGAPKRFHGNTDGSMESIAQVLDALSLPAESKEDLFRRFVMAILTGNGDMHSENLSIVGGKGSHRLAPIYDPAPMRAYRGGANANHNLLSALSFAGIGGVLHSGEDPKPYTESGETPPDLGEKLLDFGVAIGIDRRRARAMLLDLVECTKDFKEEAVAVLEALPAEIKKTRLPDIDGFARTLDEVRVSIARSLKSGSKKGF